MRIDTLTDRLGGGALIAAPAAAAPTPADAGREALPQPAMRERRADIEERVRMMLLEDVSPEPGF